VATRDVFSAEELAQLRGFPDVSRAELIRYFTLTPADEAFVRKFRGQGNVLGAGVQLCTLPWLGFVPDEVPAAPVAAVARLSTRLGIPVGELRGYGTRGQTRTDHLREIVGYLGWRTMDSLEWKELEEFLFARAMEHDSPKLLFRQACEYLSSSRVVRPGVVNVLERVATARARAGQETWTRVAHLLDERRRVELDGLLVVDPILGRTRLTWLGIGPTAATPAAVKSELEKLAYLRRMDAHTLDLSMRGVELEALLDDILAIVLDPEIADEQVGAALRNGVGMERMRAARAAGRERLPRDHGHLALLDASMGYLRRLRSRTGRQRRHRRRARRHPPGAQRRGPAADLRRTHGTARPGRRHRTTSGTRSRGPRVART
jgi:hypothetical protein